MGLIYRSTWLVETVADREGAAAYKLGLDRDRTVRETLIMPRLLR